MCRQARIEADASRSAQTIATLDDINQARHYQAVIESFADKETERVWNRQFSRRLPREVQVIGRRKLVMLHRSRDLNDLRVPPANRLERLRGKREGRYSIRINNQWRVCFKWNRGTATDVEIVDYH